MILQKKLSFVRALGAILLTVGCFAFGVFGNLITEWGTGIHPAVVMDGWVKFESEKADFKIYFPEDPQEESKQIILPDTGKVLDYEQITHENEEIAYSVTHMKIPNKWKLAGNATLLKLSLEAMVKHSEGGKLLDKQFIMHQGHRALDYTLIEEGKRIKGRLIVIGNMMYRLAATSPSHLKEQGEGQLFLDSFVPFQSQD